jgi:hypothetical protein
MGINRVTGFVFHQEAAKYLELSKTLDLYNYNLYFEKYKFYMTYVVYLKILKVLFNNYQIVYLHIILLYLSSLMIYSVLYKEYKNKQLSLFGRVLFLFCYPVHFWTTSLYIEPFFIILFITIFYLVHSRSSVLIIGIISFLFMFSRPNGAVSLVFLAIYYFSQRNKAIKQNVLAIYTFGIIFVIVAILFIKVDSGFQLAAIMNKEALGLSKTTDATGLRVRDNLWNTYSLIINQIGYKSFAILMVKKVYWFFNMTRPYYSLGHNIVYGFYMLYFILGALAIRCQMKIKEHECLGKIIYFLFLSNFFLVVLYQNEWHNRLNIVALPLLCMSIAPYVFNKLNRNHGEKLE